MPAALSVSPYGSANTPYRRASFVVAVVDVAGGVPSLNTSLSTNSILVEDTGTGIITLTIPTGSRGVIVGEPAVVAVDGTSLQTANVQSYVPSTGVVVVNTYTAADVNEADITGQIQMVFLVEGG